MRNTKQQLQALSPARVKKTLTPTTPSKKSMTQSKQPISQQSQQVVKVRQKFFVFPQLQDIFIKLNLNSFQLFPFEQIEQGRNKINDIFKKMKSHESPMCLVHDQLLNLYCEKDREMVCVDCVYRDHKHKGHSIAPLDRMYKSLQMESMRNKDKVQTIIDRLLEWQQSITNILSQISDSYLKISNNMISVFKSMIDEIDRVQSEFSKVILQNYTRTTNIIKKYGQTVEKARGAFHSQLRVVGELDEINQMQFLRKLNQEIVVCERLIKRTHQTINMTGVWKQISTLLERLNQRKRKDQDQTRERQIIVTQF